MYRELSIRNKEHYHEILSFTAYLINSYGIESKNKGRVRHWVNDSWELWRLLKPSQKQKLKAFEIAFWDVITKNRGIVE